MSQTSLRTLLAWPPKSGVEPFGTGVRAPRTGPSSRSLASILTIFDHTTEQPLLPTLIHIFGIEICRFMHVYGGSEEDLARVSVLCKANALGHPAAQVAQKLSVEEVLAA